MKRFFKVLAILLLALVIICGISLLTDKSKFGKWDVRKTSTAADPAWIPFYWTSEILGKKYFEKTAMLIRAKLNGLPYTFSLQFDLGSFKTILYEKNLLEVLKQHPELKKHIGRLKSILQFWNSNKSFRNIQLDLGPIQLTSNNCMIEKNYGSNVSLNDEPIPLGTIGADVFRNKVLIMDYPNERFAICDSVPPSYPVAFFSKIDLLKDGRILLPMRIKNKTYKILFDNGSSLFPLLLTDDRVTEFSLSSPVDTIAINSWGTIHNVIGRRMKDSFQLAQESFSDVMLYADYRKQARTNQFDGIAGNALFWDKTIIIDFRNKTFGLVQ